MQLCVLHHSQRPERKLKDNPSGFVAQHLEIWQQVEYHVNGVMCVNGVWVIHMSFLLGFCPILEFIIGLLFVRRFNIVQLQYSKGLDFRSLTAPGMLLFPEPVRILIADTGPMIKKTFFQC
jgi:hypothetical protein